MMKNSCIESTIPVVTLESEMDKRISGRYALRAMRVSAIVGPGAPTEVIKHMIDWNDVIVPHDILPHGNTKKWWCLLIAYK